MAEAAIDRPSWARQLFAWLWPWRAAAPAPAAPAPTPRATGRRAAAPAYLATLEPLIDDLLAPRRHAAAPPLPDDPTVRALVPLLGARDRSLGGYRPALGRLSELLDLAPDDFNGAVRAVTREPAIVTALLATANSAEFRRGAAVLEVREAVERLGLVHVRQLAIAITARALHDPELPTGRHALAERDLHRAMTTAFAASWLTLQRGLPHGDRAFVAALFLDIGRPLAYRDLARLEHAAGRAPVPEAVAERVVDRVHADLGADTLTAWGLPIEIAALCRYHHADAVPAALDRPEVHAVRVVSGLVHLRAGEPPTAALRASLAALGCDRHALRALAVVLDELADRASLILGQPPTPAAWPELTAPIDPT